MKFKYVGEKQDGERAFKDKTGIEWMPGSEHDVADAEVAEQMLKHPTVWQPVAKGAVLADAKAPAQPAAAAPAAAPAADSQTDDADPLAGLDDKGVKAWVKARGLEVPGINPLKGDKLRAKVRAALAAK